MKFKNILEKNLKLIY